MIVGVVRETAAGERRVSLVPAGVAALVKAKLDVLVEKDAGLSAGFSNDAYKDSGAELVSATDLASRSEVILKASSGPTSTLKANQVGIAVYDPLAIPGQVPGRLRAPRSFSLDLQVPRTTRAQAMDVLSSQANLGGYLGVLIGATELTKILPMMTTAAGTIPPARTLILGAGVAGLQAIATARRLGAVVERIRRSRGGEGAGRKSLGARFVELLTRNRKSAQDCRRLRQGAGRRVLCQAAAVTGRRAGRRPTDLVITTAAGPRNEGP